MKVKLKCKKAYTDTKLKKNISIGEEIIVDKKRADELLSHPFKIVEFVECIAEEKPKERAVKPRKKVEKR